MSQLGFVQQYTQEYEGRNNKSIINRLSKKWNNYSQWLTSIQKWLRGQLSEDITTVINSGKTTNSTLETLRKGHENGRALLFLYPALNSQILCTVIVLQSSNRKQKETFRGEDSKDGHAYRVIFVKTHPWKNGPKHRYMKASSSSFKPRDGNFLLHTI